MYPVKRRHERRSTHRSVAVQVEEWTGLEAVCRDVSYGGACLVVTDPVEVGDKLLFDLAIEGAGTASLTGTVRHVTELEDGRYVIGIAWAKPREGHGRRMLEAYVDSAA